MNALQCAKGHAVDVTVKFCPECGTRVEAQPNETTDIRPVPRGLSRNQRIGAGVILALVVGYIIQGTSENSGNSTFSSTVSSYVTVKYLLEGSASAANLTYTDGSGDIQQQTGKKVPLTKKSDGSEGIEFRVLRGSFVQFSAQNKGGFGDLTCKIHVDGVTVDTGYASGGYAIVSCSTRV